MSAIGWPAITTGLKAWVMAGSGLASSQVYMAFERGSRPPTQPYIIIGIEEIVKPGTDWTVRETVPADPPDEPEEMLRIKARGHRVALLRLTCFAPKRDSLYLLHDVISTEASEYALGEAGVGLGVMGPVQLVGDERSELLEPRSTVDIRIHLSSELERITDFIERIQVTLEVEDPPIEEEIWIPDPPPP